MPMGVPVFFLRMINPLALKGHTIMAHDCMISRTVAETQKHVFGIATDPMRGGVPLKVIASRADIPYSTLRTYADGSAHMSLVALHKLARALPAELAMLLLPDCLTAPAVDHDDLGRRCIEYVARLHGAHHPASECGEVVGPNEARDLAAAAAGLRAVA